MGTFQGHVLPGLFFMSFGVWWTAQISRRFLYCRKQGLSFHSSAIYPCCQKRCINWPLEPLVKILVTGTGMALEVFASTDYGRGPGVVFIDDLQHVTMYLFFLLAGIVELLQWRGTIDVPHLEYIFGAGAFAMEWLLFYNHLHDRSELDVLVHTLLLYAIAGCVISTLLEMRYRTSLVAALGRPFCVLLQGTWFVQVAFILYNPFPSLASSKSENNDHRQMTLATLMFAWHLVGVALAMVVLSVISRACTKRYFPLIRGEDYEMVGWPPELPMPDHGSQTNLFAGSGYTGSGAEEEFTMMGHSSGEDSEESVEVFSSRAPLTTSGS